MPALKKLRFMLEARLRCGGQSLYLHSIRDRNENMLWRGREEASRRKTATCGESVGEEGEEKQSLTLSTVALPVYKPTWDYRIYEWC